MRNRKASWLAMVACTALLTVGCNPLDRVSKHHFAELQNYDSVRVTDNQGKPLPGANINWTETAGTVVHSRITDRDGRAAIDGQSRADLKAAAVRPDGAIDIEVSAAGYESFHAHVQRDGSGDMVRGETLEGQRPSVKGASVVVRLESREHDTP